MNGDLDYDYGATLWLRRNTDPHLNELDLAILKFRYYVLVLEGEAEEADHECTADCEHWKSKEK